MTAERLVQEATAVPVSAEGWMARSLAAQAFGLRMSTRFREGWMAHDAGRTPGERPSDMSPAADEAWRSGWWAAQHAWTAAREEGETERERGNR